MPDFYDNGAWYRLYNDNWVIQGAAVSVMFHTESAGSTTVRLLVPMQDIEYTLTITGSTVGGISYIGYNYESKTTASFSIGAYRAQANILSLLGQIVESCWRAEGVAA